MWFHDNSPLIWLTTLPYWHEEEIPSLMARKADRRIHWHLIDIGGFVRSGIISVRLKKPPQAAAGMGRVEPDFGKRRNRRKAQVRLDERYCVGTPTIVRDPAVACAVVQIYSRSARRKILPTGVFGSSVLNSICLGTL